MRNEEHFMAAIFAIIDQTILFLPKLIIAIVLLWLVSVIAKLVQNFVIHVASKARLDITLSHALGSISSVGINIVGILIATVILIPGFKMVHVISGLGITSVAIGFAFKDILENFLAGLILLWQKPFAIGDLIKTADFEGTVESVRIRSTYLRTTDGELVLVPNSTIFTNPIIVRTASKNRKSEATLMGNPKRSVEQNRKIIKQIIDSIDEISKSPPPEILLTDISTGKQTFKILFWSDIANISAATDKLNSRIYDALYEHTN